MRRANPYIHTDYVTRCQRIVGWAEKLMGLIFRWDAV
jgi:hypothetical protein